MRLVPMATMGERAADELRTMILRGDLPPGSELKQDRLAEQFGVSRVPVREALAMLERDGLVTVKPNRRVVVSEVTDADLLDHYAVRALIEGEAAARAARSNVDPSVLTAAQRQNEEARLSDDLTSFLSSSTVLHRSIWDAGGGFWLKAMATQLWSGRDYTPADLPQQLARASSEHALIIEAICDRAPERARQAMTDHIMKTAGELLAYRARLADGAARPHVVTRP
jgi:DNA-binding GntR family transcriptional regulator